MDGNQNRSPLQMTVEALAVLATTLIQVWSMLSPDERMWMRLALSSRLSKLRAAAAGLAAREGHAGMADELAGHVQAARSRYGAAAAWSRLRDAIGRAATGVRP